ncbi:MAG: hypothetical protein KGL39_10025 [Patescibacteria group bacterium]|nr:hypothetical protein [Patescibacteria group bacterium]
MPQKTVRVPLATEFLNRDATLTKDSRLVNAYIEKYYDGRSAVVKRPGLLSYQENGIGMGQGIISHAGKLVTVVGNKVYASGLTGGSRTIATSNEVVYFEVLSIPLAPFPNRPPNSTLPPVTGDPLSSPANSGNTSVRAALDGLPASSISEDFLFIKGASCAYYWNGYDNELTQITDNNYPLVTVPGVVQLDGYIFVMDSNGVIYNSNLQDQRIWNSLDFIQAEVEPDGGVAIAKHLNYIVAFGKWSTEFFYDAGNALGSPLARVDNAFFPIGCANGNSVVAMDTSVIWVSQTKEDNAKAGRGREVTMLNGMTPKKISTPFVDRILSNDSMRNIRALTLKSQGHDFYILTLVDSLITVVYDMTIGVWYQWTGFPKMDFFLTESCTIGNINNYTRAQNKQVPINGSDTGGYAYFDLIDQKYIVTFQNSASFLPGIVPDGYTAIFLYDLNLNLKTTFYIPGMYTHLYSYIHSSGVFNNGVAYFPATLAGGNNSILMVNVYTKEVTFLDMRIAGSWPPFDAISVNSVVIYGSAYYYASAYYYDQGGIVGYVYLFNMGNAPITYTLLKTYTAPSSVIDGTFIGNSYVFVAYTTGTTLYLDQFDFNGNFISTITLDTGSPAAFPISYDVQSTIFAFRKNSNNTISLYNTTTNTSYLSGLPYSYTSFVNVDTSAGLVYSYDGTTLHIYNTSGTLLVTDTNIFSAFDSPVFGAFITNSESFYSPSFHTNLGGTDYLLDYGSGTVWKTSEFYYTDGANDGAHNIPVHVITPNLDFGNNHSKPVSELEIIGDKVSGTINVCYSNNDYQNWSTYRLVNLGNPRSRLHRLGKARRRAYEFYYTDATALRLEAVDLTMDGVGE